MEEKVGKILDLILQGLQTAGKVASEQFPVLLHQLTVYYAIDSIPFISAAIFIGGAILIVCGVRLVKADDEDAGVTLDAGFALVTFGLLASLVSGGFVMDGTKAFFQAKYAPEAFLLMKLKEKK